jgi:hypothetical protein
MVAHSPAIERILLGAGSVVVAAASGGLAVLFARKWWRGSPAVRRALAPVVAVGAVRGLLGVAQGIAQGLFPPGGSEASWFWPVRVLMAAGSLAFLDGLLRTRLSRASVGDLVVELGGCRVPERGLRDALAKRLRDPSLEIAYFLRERGTYVDVQGNPLDLPADGAGRTVTVLESDGQPIAALVHDEVLRHDPEIVESVAAATRLAISNERLRAEVQAQLSEVRASRARIVSTGVTRPDVASSGISTMGRSSASSSSLSMSGSFGIVPWSGEEKAGSPDRAGRQECPRAGIRFGRDLVEEAGGPGAHEKTGARIRTLPQAPALLTTHRKPMCPVEVSMVSAERAAGR